MDIFANGVSTSIINRLGWQDATWVKYWTRAFSTDSRFVVSLDMSVQCCIYTMPCDPWIPRSTRSLSQSKCPSCSSSRCFWGHSPRRILVPIFVEQWGNALIDRIPHLQTDVRDYHCLVQSRSARWMERGCLYFMRSAPSTISPQSNSGLESTATQH